VGRKKHVPQRTCVACRQIKNKRELVRVVRAPEGLAEVDETGKKSGRGAYVCRSASCWRKALEKDALNRALKMTLTVEHKDELRKSIESLPEECATGEAEAVASI
jgi:predicted RNA-binding protein YlxR (DUF448 family)